MSEIIPHFIAGARTQGQDTRRSDVFDPATGAVQRQVALGTMAFYSFGAWMASLSANIKCTARKACASLKSSRL